MNCSQQRLTTMWLLVGEVAFWNSLDCTRSIYCSASFIYSIINVLLTHGSLNIWHFYCRCYCSFHRNNQSKARFRLLDGEIVTKSLFWASFREVWAGLGTWCHPLTPFHLAMYTIDRCLFIGNVRWPRSHS